MLRLAFDFIITWRETRTRPNAYLITALLNPCTCTGSGFKSLKGYLAARTSGEGFSATQQELAAVSNCRSHA